MNAGKLLRLSRYYYPAGNYMFKVNNRNTRTRCDICSKLTIKTPEWRQNVFIVNFEHTSHLVLVFLLLTFEQVNAGWVPYFNENVLKLELLQYEWTPQQIFFCGYHILQLFYHNVEGDHDIKCSQK